MNELKEKLKLQIVEYLLRPDTGVTFVDYIVEISIRSVIQDILNFCNLTELPKELEHVVIRRVIGNLLEYYIRVNGADNLNIDKMVRSISEGDVSITYDDKLDRNLITFKFIEESKNYGHNDLYSFRTMRW